MSVRLETPRLNLTRFALSDVDEVFQCITPAITRFMAWDPPAYDDFKSRSEALCAADEKIEIRFVIRRRDTGECLGIVSIHRLGDPLPELGVWLKQEAQGQGSGSEAIQAVAAWATAEWNADGFIYPVALDNIASRRIAERLKGKIIAQRSSQKYDFVVYRLPNMAL